MLRNLLPLLALALTPADYTICTVIDNGPIVNQKPPVPFARQPDFAAVTEYPKTEFFDGMPPPSKRAASAQEIRLVFGHVEECGKPNVPGHPNAFFAACIRGQIMYLQNPCDYGDTERFARLACHENAHLFWDWPKDHGP